MNASKTNGDNYSLWGLIGLKRMCEQPRANETVCYLKLNGNEASVNHYLMQRKGMENSCIRQYTIKEGGNAEIAVEGGRSDLAEELRRFGISRDEISLVPPMKQYSISALLVEDGYSLLDIAGSGTRCVDFGGGEIEILTDMFPHKIIRKLGGLESEIYVSENGRR